MAEQTTHRSPSLFDFAPRAGQYDRWYDTPVGRAHDQAQQRDVRRLLAPASPNQTLLDVGCGTGHWSGFFAEMGYRVTGVDVAEAMIEAARTALPQCTFQVADACRLPFDDGVFDVVTAMATLEFLPDPAAAVDEMVRCATAGGRLLIGTLNRLAPLNQHRVSKGKEPYASAHLFSPDDVRNLVAPRGRVRMVASPLPGHGGRPRRPEGVERWTAGLRRKLKGPFLVAEVRL